MEPATQIRPPEDPPVCPVRLSLSPWLQAGLAVFFFFLIEQIFIEHLLQAVPTLLPPWPLTWANSSSKSRLSGKAPLTPLPLSPAPWIGQGVPLSLSVPPSIMVGTVSNY